MGGDIGLIDESSGYRSREFTLYDVVSDTPCPMKLFSGCS